MITEPVCSRITKESGGHSVSSLSVPAASEVIIQVPLSSNSWKCGILYLYLPNSISFAARRRTFSSIMFGTDFDDAMSQSAENKYISFSMHFWNFPVMKGWRYVNDGALSKTEYATSSGQVRLKKCRIVGSNLELTIENTHGSVDSLFTGEMEYIVWQ